MQALNEFFIIYVQNVFDPLYSLVYAFILSFDLSFNQTKFITFSLIFFIPILFLNTKLVYKIIVPLGLSSMCIAIQEVFKENGFLDMYLSTRIASYISLFLIGLVFLQAVKRIFK